MKTDKLEQFVSNRRDEFDLYDPDPSIWNRVETRKNPILSMSWKTLAWRAAVIVLVFGFSWVLNDLTDKQDKTFVADAGEQLVPESNPLMNDLLDAEVYYTSRISIKKEEIASLTLNQPEILEEIEQEFEDLNQVFDELKKDLNDNAHNEEVIEAMILNYRIKLQILEDMLMLIKPAGSGSDDELKRI